MLHLREGDLEPDLVATLEQPAGTPIPIGLAPVVVRVKKAGETDARFERACEVLSDGLEGRPARVRYQWQAGDTDDSGVYFCVWKITWDGSEPQTVPSKSVSKFRITP